MTKLTKVVIHKYKCIETDQEFDVDDDITVLVGMNESGKTSILEALAKTNHFDGGMKFNATHDYPRRQKKKMDKTAAQAVTCEYQISDQVLAQIADDIGEGALRNDEISVTYHYNKDNAVSRVAVDSMKFAATKTDTLGISSKALNAKLAKVTTTDELAALTSEYSDEKITSALPELTHYYENKWCWEGDPIGEYVYRTHIQPSLPKYLYYDEYYSLPARIPIEALESSELDDAEDEDGKGIV